MISCSRCSLNQSALWLERSLSCWFNQLLHHSFVLLHYRVLSLNLPKGQSEPAPSHSTALSLTLTTTLQRDSRDECVMEHSPQIHSHVRYYMLTETREVVRSFRSSETEAALSLRLRLCLLVKLYSKTKVQHTLLISVPPWWSGVCYRHCCHGFGFWAFFWQV